MELKKKFFCLIFGFALVHFDVVNSVKVNKDGGYEILLALDENAPVPKDGIGRFLANVKSTLTVFSNQMWLATRNKFYVRNADILLPSSWIVETESASLESYENADIRMSAEVPHPRVDNPNICGQPGNHIELPNTFFNVSNSGPYGLHWKSLLHLWALYRFGVHSEHGYVGDSRFPYASINSDMNPVVTGCSDEPIQGKFIDLTNPDAHCDSDDSFPENCRFVPDSTGQNATTSLMHFHWVQSVTEFCDQHNHNKFAPNKQNMFCDHKSVWEVIRESSDYGAVTSQRNASIPGLKFRVLTPSATPIFYILLDRGLVQGSFPIANIIPPQLAKLVGSENLGNTVCSIGAFPGPDGNSVVTDVVPFTTIGSNVTAFLDAIGTLRNDGPLERDFSRAILAVAQKIKAKQHPNGAVVLLVKYGADIKNFAKYLPESEVINALNEANIIFNSLELTFPNHTTGYSHLANVARETGGSYSTVENYGEAERNLANVLGYVGRTLREEYKDLRRSWKTLRKEAITSGASFGLPAGVKGKLQMFISSVNGYLTERNFTVNGFDHSGGVTLPRTLKFAFYKTIDWNQIGSRTTYRLEVAQAELAGVPQISLAVECRTGICSSNLMARAEFTGDMNQVKISVFTSVESNEADLSFGRPISIFAKITKNGVPVRGANVEATLTEIRSSARSIIVLVDDGKASPDIQELDGIYSAYFAPKEDGRYQLSVMVEGDSRSPRVLQENGLLPQLLPIDQRETGSNETETFDGVFSQNIELSSAFSVVQAALYAPTPTKISSLSLADHSDRNTLTLSWPAPLIPGRSSEKATSYEIRSAPSLNLLIEDFDNQTKEEIPLSFKPSLPGRNDSISLTRPRSTRYYAVRSIYNDKQSAPSHPVKLIIETLPPTTSTTSSRPTPTVTGETSSATGSTEASTGDSDSTGSSSSATGTSTSAQPSSGATDTTPTGDPESTTATATGKSQIGSFITIITVIIMLYLP